MKLSNWNLSTKAQTSAAKYVTSTINRYINNNGTLPAFDYHFAVASIQGFLFAAFTLNAQKVASTKLRAYVNPKKDAVKLFNSRKVSPKTKAFLLGDKGLHTKNANKPSQEVVTKFQKWNGDMEEITDGHQCLETILHPNPDMSGLSFIELAMMFLQTTGNTYFHPIVEAGTYRDEEIARVTEMYILPSQYVKIIPAPSGSDTLVAGYRYGCPSATELTYSPDEVMHLKLSNMKNQLYGMGRVESQYSTVRLSQEQRATDISKYSQQARPDIVVNTKSANTTMDQLIELQNRWANDLLGSWNAGKPAFTTGDTEIIQIPWAEFQPGEKERILEEMSAVSGVPVAKLLSNDPNLSNAEVANNAWLLDTVTYYLQVFEHFWNHNYLAHYPEDVRDNIVLVYDDPLPENREEIRLDMKAFSDVITVDERRAILGYPELGGEDGKRLGNLTRADIEPKGTIVPGAEDNISDSNPDKTQENK